MKVTATALLNMGYHNTGRICMGDEVWHKIIEDDGVIVDFQYIHYNRKTQRIVWQSQRSYRL